MIKKKQKKKSLRTHSKMHLPATQLQLNKIQIHYLAHLMWISVTIKILSHLD